MVIGTTLIPNEVWDTTLIPALVGWIDALSDDQLISNIKTIYTDNWLAHRLKSVALRLRMRCFSDMWMCVWALVGRIGEAMFAAWDRRRLRISSKPKPPPEADPDPRDRPDAIMGPDPPALAGVAFWRVLEDIFHVMGRIKTDMRPRHADQAAGLRELRLLFNDGVARGKLAGMIS